MLAIGSDCLTCEGCAQGNPVDVDAAPALLAPGIDVPRLFRAAARVGGEKSEAVGFAAGYQPSHWTRILSCERGIRLDSLGRLPIDVQQAFVAAWAAELGMRIERRDGTARRAAALALAQAAAALAETL